jgi:glycosyltransferase involved in cell wall biosynthesis
MRICLVSIHPSLVSGQISSLIGLAHILRQRGHEVRIVSSFPEDRLACGLQNVAGETGGWGELLKVPNALQVISQLRTTAATADVVHLNLPTPSFAFLGNLAQSLLGRPIVVGFEAHLPAPGDIWGPRVVEAPLFYVPQFLIHNRLLARLGGYHAGRYVVASKYQASELECLGASTERISIIPNVIDPRRLRAEGNNPLVGWPESGPTIAYIGHFNHGKGVDLLVRAMPHVLAEHPEARLVLAWSGMGRWQPVAQAITATRQADRIRVTGRVPVGTALQRTDVCVLPYRLTAGQAAFPDLLLEALSTGVPLVTTNLPLLRELIEPGRQAELAEPENPRDLARAINRLLSSAERRRQMVAQQRLLVHQVYNPEKLAAQYEALYESCVGVASSQGENIPPSRAA